MPAETALALAPALEMETKARKISVAEKVFRSMRAKLEEIFPEDDEEAWSWTGEDFETHRIDPPESDFEAWLSEQYEESDEFTQRLVRRMFTIWHEMEQDGFKANDKELYEHQKALFAWIAISTATGVREEIANVLVRSPYGSGKSLVSGLVVRAFREVQEELLAEGEAENTIPTGILLGLRREHMLQNAMGKQFAVLQPPYTVERPDINVYWRNLGTMFGSDFSEVFPRPAGKKHPFYDLFDASEDEEHTTDPATRLQTYLATLKGPQLKMWSSLSNDRQKEITAMLLSLMEGKVILLPDVYNVPRAERALPREEEEENDVHGYKGDSAYALTETSTYRVKATHKHLALNRSSYTTTPNLENPAQFCIAYGTMVTRAAENIRADVREEVMRRCRGMFIDEAGAYTPMSLGDSASELSGSWPFIVGFTGQDKGIEGWTGRSPVLSVQKMVELGLMKPIAFQGIGDAEKPPAQGSEEAWDAYRKEMFQDVKTATTLKLPQPRELDTVVVAPTQNVREYAHRIMKAHEEEGIPVKVWCFDSAAGDSRWSTVVSGFNAPKEPGEPRRILVSPPSQMSEALHLHAECYDILAAMNTFALDQTRGRLGHIRNDAEGKDREKARTYFRVQWLDGARGEPYIRKVAEMMGYELDEENATWRPLHAMIDKAAYERDEERKGLSAPVPIPDAAAVAKRKRRKKEKAECTQLENTSPYMIELERKREERRGLKEKHFAEARSHVKTHGATPPAAKQAPGKPEKKPLERKIKATKGNKSITLVLGANDLPMNLGDLAQKFGVTGYLGSLKASADDAHRGGLRGEQLAEAVLEKLLRLHEAVERRSNPKQAEHSGSGRNIETHFVHG